MPASHTSSSGLSSFSDSSRRLISTRSPHISFSDYLEHFENDNTYSDLMVALFGRQDLIVKTNKLKHLAALVEQLQNEIDSQQEYMREIFDTMEAAGLHEQLKKFYIWDNGVVQQQRFLRFESPDIPEPPKFRHTPTPYPRPRAPSPRIKKPFQQSFSPTASEYQVPSSSIIFDPSAVTQPRHYNFYDALLRQVKEEKTPPPAQWNVRQVDWVMHQGGIGTYFNLIIVEDD